MAWSTMVLFPKNDNRLWRIGLLESTWSIISAIIDTRLTQSIQFHDPLHGFRVSRGTGTAIIEAKLHQQLAALDQEPLYIVFIDLAKAYDTIDCHRALDILSANGVGPNIIRLLTNFWNQATVALQQSGYYSTTVTTQRGCI
jgi:hypothetical protein